MKKPDRRVARSKQSLGRALVSLMITKGFEETTVSDITEYADVGRSTFYAHYADKEDLLQDTFQGLRAHLTSNVVTCDPNSGPTHPALAFSLPMLLHVYEQKELFRSSIRSGQLVQEHLRTMLTDLVVDKLSEGSELDDQSIQLQAHFITGSFIAVLRWWMQDDPSTVSPQEVDAHFRKLVLLGLPVNGTGSPYPKI